MIQIGDTFGELTVEKQLPSDRGARRWFCRCDCGGEAIRTTSALLESRRNNRNPCCARCLKELRQGLWIEHTIISANRFKRLWDDRGELWSTGVLDWIEADIRDEVGLELGGWQEWINPPSIDFWDYGPDLERPVDDELTLKEIGKFITENAQGKPVHGISRERVRQLETQALGKLKSRGWTGHRILKRFHEAGIPTGVEGLDVAHDSYVEPEPEVQVSTVILDKAIALAIHGKKNAQRPAWCGIGEAPENVSAKRRAEHMALIDAAIVRAREWERVRDELTAQEAAGKNVGVWSWWAIPGTMRPKDEPQITEALRKIPKPPIVRIEKGPPETWRKRAREQRSKQSQAWRGWIDRMIKEKSR